MSRGLWFVAGAGAGVYAMIRGRRAAEALTPEGLRDRLSGLAVGARMFREELAQGQADAEPVLRERLGLSAPGPAQLGGRRPSSPAPPPELATEPRPTGAAQTGPAPTTPQRGTT